MLSCLDVFRQCKAKIIFLLVFCFSGLYNFGKADMFEIAFQRATQFSKLDLTNL